MSKTKAERIYQKDLVKKIKEMFTGCVVTKLDPRYTQGIPDLLILYNDKWATLECKAYAKAKRRPNQGYWVDRLNKMSFSSFIYPENEKEVLDDLQRAFQS